MFSQGTIVPDAIGATGEGTRQASSNCWTLKMWPQSPLMWWPAGILSRRVSTGHDTIGKKQGDGVALTSSLNQTDRDASQVRASTTMEWVVSNSGSNWEHVSRGKS